MNVIKVQRTLFRRSGNRQSTICRSFRELTQSYFAGERSLEFVIEAILFAVIVALSAWPVFAAADALNEFLQRSPG